MKKDIEKEYLEAYYGQAVGLTVVGVKVTKDEFDGTSNWVTLVCQYGDLMTVELEISQDEEGNGPGFVFGLPSVRVVKDESGELQVVKG